MVAKNAFARLDSWVAALNDFWASLVNCVCGLSPLFSFSTVALETLVRRLDENKTQLLMLSLHHSGLVTSASINSHTLLVGRLHRRKEALRVSQESLAHARQELVIYQDGDQQRVMQAELSATKALALG